MSETERRRKYRWDRVLIETDRLFNPQFDDAVVYLTGAQLEMLRNTTQNLRRPETYVSEYAMGYYLTPTVEDYDRILAMVADLEEELMGNPNTLWGYKDRWKEAKEEEGIGAGQTAVNSDPVPEGYVYKLEHWMIMHAGGAGHDVTLGVIAGGAVPYLYRAPNLSAYVFVYEGANITLKEGDYISFSVTNLPAETFAYLRLLGYKMAVP